MAGYQGSTTDPLVPTNTPFSYNVGINYESWEVGRTGYSITADLNQINKNFNLIRTYHDAAVGTDDPTTPSIDSTQDQVIDWIVANPGTELVMGTNNNALAQGGYGQPWSAGLMVSSAYTDLWVDMIIDAFGSVAKVKAGLKAILLGNELDQNGPPPSSGHFDDYVNTWIPTAFDNLQTSLANAGLGSIPISTTIANYGASNVVSVNVPAYISSNWSDTWNNDEAFVMFNQYTANNGQSKNYGPVESYFESVETALGANLDVFVGETGYSTFYGATNQKAVYRQMFDWLGGMYNDGGKTVPLFLFDAFDRPAVTPAFEVQYGIYGENANSQPTGLKANMKGVIPAWTDNKIGAKAGAGDDTIYGTGRADVIQAFGGADIVLGRGGGDRLFGYSGGDVLCGNAGDDDLRGGRGADYLEGDTGEDGLFGGIGADTLFGGRGLDTLRGGRGHDRFVLEEHTGRDIVADFEDGVDHFVLGGDLAFADLTFNQVEGDTEIIAGGRVLAVVQGTAVADFTGADFLVI